MTRVPLDVYAAAARAAIVAMVALPAPAFACGGRCATAAGPLFGTLIAIAAGVWIVARAATWLRGRLQTQRAHQITRDLREDSLGGDG